MPVPLPLSSSSTCPFISYLSTQHKSNFKILQVNKPKQFLKSKSNKCSMKSNNYHNLNTSTIIKDSNMKLCGYYQNVRDLRTKINVIKCSVLYFFFNFIILSETWLNKEYIDHGLGISNLKLRQTHVVP